MNRQAATQLYERAMAHLKRTRPDVLKDARKVGPRTFQNLTARQFLAEYCWVVYASGFRFSTVEAGYPHIRRAFRDFDIARLVEFLSKSRRASKHIVDVALWHYGSDANFGRAANSALQATRPTRA